MDIWELGTDVLLLLRAVDLDLLFPQRSQLFLAELHVCMDGLARHGEGAHEVNDRNTILHW